MKKLSEMTIPPWTWSFVAAFIVLVLTLLVSSGSGFQTLTLAFTIAPYLVLVALGQMLVMSSGPGNIDVSVAKVFSLGGLLAIAVSDATGSFVLGLLAAMAAGLVMASISVLAILVIRIPPIVATLATSLIASAISLTLANGFQGSADPALKAFLGWAPMGIPAFAVLVLIFTLFISFVLRSTAWGTRMLAFGQARRAAAFAGISTTNILLVVYLSCGMLAGLAGALRASFSAPNVELGNDYLLDSIAVVVIGGTLITGGRAVPAGVWGGALFFILLDGLLNLIGWSFAGQNVLKGFLVLGVLFLAGGAPILTSRAKAVKPQGEPEAEGGKAAKGKLEEQTP
ncbi:monosaccharide ABC transporter membrane protein, CUT2 family (TC 3.A.1.2.-) [Cohaesibacter sp. ES.047]|uniref:ABC transporter permease n=1 Tax=Cohaesibacter sp. ES.047 TaxID=1798205 RepID=UPI000BB93C18|nr:ABC transporter permease [Cohaesibacter sp. ES.047]SNY91074.1 monosaccharide ABC transporter membrane protein, CUT2 family (TC 3.A.1.2.-) [Cohaesibacter sp. ES.047]